MNPEHLNERLSPPQYAARLDAAKTQAVALRAAAIDAFWSRLVRNAWHPVRRSLPTPATHPSLETSPCRR